MSVFLLALAWASPALSQGTLIPFVTQYFNDASGNPVNSAKLCSYIAGSSTPLATYSDIGLTTANANPTRTSANGRPTTGAIYLSPGNSYKFILLTAGADNTCATGTTLWTLDNVPAIPTAAGNLDLTSQTAGETLIVGDVVYLSDGSGALTAGRWYKADADTTYSSSTAALVGVSTTAISSGATGTIRIAGRVTGLSGLTAGELYYVSATAGGLTNTPPTNQWFVGKAESTTVLLLGGQNQGGVRLPDSDGTHSIVVTTPTNATADRLVSLVVPDAAATLTQAPYSLMEGRLTLTSALPVTTANVTAATTLYWALYKGNRVTLYTGTAWITVSIAQLSIAVPATTATMYDVFIDYTAGSPALELVAWTNDTTRAVALATQDGVFVQTADADSRYVGSFRTTGVSGQTEDSLTYRGVWNYYNQVPRLLKVVETTDSWNSVAAVWRQANASTANQVAVVIGVQEAIQVDLTVLAIWNSNNLADQGASAIGQNSITVPMASSPIADNRQYVASFKITNVVRGLVYPAIGYSYFAWLENAPGLTGTQTWYGDNGATGYDQSGMNGFLSGG